MPMPDNKENEFEMVNLDPFDRLKNIIESIETDMPKVKKGNKSAMRRCRVKSMGAITALRAFRKQLLGQ